MNINERFWNKVNKTDTCWLWNVTNKNYYGSLRITKNGKAYNHKAHRMSWEMHNGTIPYGLNVLHKCDNPPCVNPDHLFLGTQKDNALDRGLKNRSNNTSAERNRNKTHCISGHIYDEKNTRIITDGVKKHRVCRACRRIQAHKARSIKKS